MCLSNIVILYKHLAIVFCFRLHVGTNKIMRIKNTLRLKNAINDSLYIIYLHKIMRIREGA